MDAVLNLDLDDLGDIIEPVTNALQIVGEDAAQQALLIVQASPTDGVISAANEKVLEFSQNRAAELVGKKLVDGKLIDNPDAQWSINEATRDMLRQSITESFQEGLGVKGLKSSIENSYAFSSERAEMIARTETLAAFNASALAGYRASGVNMKKKWLTAPDACDEICIPNEEQGAIPLDELFVSGDDHPPGHPRCRCTLIPVVIREEKASKDSLHAGYIDASQPETIHDDDIPDNEHDAHQSHDDVSDELHPSGEGSLNFDPADRSTERNTPFKPSKGKPAHDGSNEDGDDLEDLELGEAEEELDQSSNEVKDV